MNTTPENSASTDAAYAPSDAGAASPPAADTAPPPDTAPPADAASPAFPQVSSEQAAALKKGADFLKTVLNFASLPLLFVGPILMIIGTLMPWAGDRAGLGYTGGGYAIVCFAIGLVLVLTMLRAFAVGYSRSGVVYLGLALAAFWSTLSYAEIVIDDESYGLWITMAGSLVTVFAVLLMRNMMPWTTGQDAGDADDQKLCYANLLTPIIVGIAGVGAFFSAFAWDIAVERNGFDENFKYGIIIFGAGILTILGAASVIINLASKTSSAASRGFIKQLWFLSGISMVAVAVPNVITSIFYSSPVPVTGLWVALACGVIILWQTHEVWRKQG